MSQQLSDQPATGRSFFKTPAFWVGCALWLAILGVAAGLMQKPAESPPQPLSAGDSAVSSPEASDGQPARITITTDKDGNARIRTPGEADESPWDKDGIADFSLIDTDRKVVTKADLLGKPWIVCFVFTHCAATCPRVTESMRELQDQLRDYDFRLVTLTVDPLRDTPDVLKAYGNSRKADFTKWHFLGGDQRDIYKLIHGSFKMPVQELQGDKRQQGFEFIHSNNIMLVDDRGVVRGKFDATKGPAMAELRREIKKLAKPLNEAAADVPADAERVDNASE